MTRKLTQVKSIEHFDELLSKGYTDFFIRLGSARSSKYITSDSEKYYVLHLIDDTEEEMTPEELMESNIGSAIMKGSFYCEED